MGSSEENKVIPVFELFLASIAVFTLIYCHSLSMSTDDVGIAAADAGTRDSWLTNLQSYRYIVVLLLLPLQYFSIPYHDFMVVWCALYALGILCFSIGFLLYCKINIRYAPAFMLLFSFNGYFINSYNFKLAFLMFGIGWLFVGLALCFLSRPSGKNLLLATLMTVLAVMSYQPVAIGLLYASAGAYLSRWLQDPETDVRRLLSYALTPVPVFLVSSIAFLIAKSVLGPDGGRPVSFENIISNIGQYFESIVELPLGRQGYWIISPVFERLTYGAALIGVAVLIARRFAVRRIAGSLLAIISLVAAILLFPGPLNLLGDVFWPSPRSLNASVAFSVLCLLLLFREVPDRSKSWLRYILVAFLCLSALNQISALVGNARQNAVDDFVAHEIVEALEQKGDLDGMKVAIVSNYYSVPAVNNYALFDAGISHFSQPWSQWNALYLASDKRIRHLGAGERACAFRSDKLFYLVEAEGGYVVCMNTGD